MSDVTRGEREDFGDAPNAVRIRSRMLRLVNPTVLSHRRQLIASKYENVAANAVRRQRYLEILANHLIEEI